MTPIASDLARVDIDSDHSISVSLEGAAKTKGSAAKSSISYQKVRNDTDIRLTSKSDGIKEELILNSPAAPDRFVYPLKLKGLTAAIEDAGDVVYRDATGVERARTPHGFMYDSKVDPNSGEPAISNGVRFSLIPYGDAQALEIRLDRQWLDSPTRVWPIVVDPDITVYTKGDDTYVMSPFNQNYSTQTELKVGKPDASSSVARAFMHFDTTQLGGKKINYAYLFTWEKHSWSCSQNPGPAYRVTSPWDGSQMTSFPGASTDDGAPASGAWWPDGRACGARAAYWDIAGMAQNWANSGETNGSVSVRANNEGSNLAWKKYHSVQAGLSLAPVLLAGYTDASPIGSLDDAIGVRGGVYVRGWTFDPDSPTAAIEAHGWAGSVGKAMVANEYRPDVGNAYPGVGNYHGYSGVIPLPPGNYNVCVAGINNPGTPGTNTWLACRSVTVSASYPDPPTITNTQGGATMAEVSWTRAAFDGGSLVTKILVTATGNGSTKTVECVASTCLNSGKVLIEGLAAGTYSFVAYAINAIGTSGPSNSASNSVLALDALAPKNVTATAGDHEATVRWTAPNVSLPAPLTGYTVKTVRTSDQVVLDKPVTFTGPTEAKVTSLENGTQVKFAVTATTLILSATTESNAVTPAGRPFPPANVAAVAENGRATVNWSPSDPNGSPILSYTVTPYLNGNALNDKTQTVGGAVTSVVITGLTNGSTYTFKVVATNAVGSSDESGPSGPTDPKGEPSAPTNVSALAGDEQAEISWSEPADNGSAILGYTVRARVAASDAVVISQPATMSPATLHGLTNGVAYYFTVQAANEVGSGPESSRSTTITPGDRPDPPSGVVATAGYGEAEVSWVAPDDNGFTISQYKVTSSPGGLTITTNGANSARFTGLNVGTPYEFRVTATNERGESDPSLASLSVKPLARYEIEMKAWIPQAWVVDPLQPTDSPYPGIHLGLEPCYDPPDDIEPFVNVISYYSGNNHDSWTGDADDHKVAASIGFDWDGSNVLNSRITPSTSFGPTHLFATYIDTRSNEVLEICQINSGSQTERAEATLAGQTFTLDYEAANAINPTPEPTIKGHLTGSVAGDGSLSLSWNSTEFPSQGVRVTRNGEAQFTFIHDVSCLGDEGVLGFNGFANISRGLSSTSITYNRTVSPQDDARTEVVESPVC